jgi:3-dehydroquinate dehydratase I
MVSSGTIAKQGVTRARKFRVLSKPLVVGAVHTLAGLRLAAKLKADDVDVVELRVDALLEHLGEIERVMPRIQQPVLLTVRHPAEGGIGNLSLKRRRVLIAQLLPWAAFLDVELRSMEALAGEIEEARARGVVVVTSDHHFRKTPSLREMLTCQRRAFRAGADLFKLAVLLPGAQELARLLEFASRPTPGPRALMGMGKFGPVSRLALAQSGSVLNYGYLDQPNAPGQWEARELKQLLGRLGSD